MTEKELYKIIFQKYSEETADFLAKEIREHFKDNDWDNYCNAVIELMNKNYSGEVYAMSRQKRKQVLLKIS